MRFLFIVGFLTLGSALTIDDVGLSLLRGTSLQQDSNLTRTESGLLLKTNRWTDFVFSEQKDKLGVVLELPATFSEFTVDFAARFYMDASTQMERGTNLYFIPHKPSDSFDAFVVKTNLGGRDGEDDPARVPWFSAFETSDTWELHLCHSATHTTSACSSVTHEETAPPLFAGQRTSWVHFNVHVEEVEIVVRVVYSGESLLYRVAAPSTNATRVAFATDRAHLEVANFSLTPNFPPPVTHDHFSSTRPTSSFTSTQRQTSEAPAMPESSPTKTLNLSSPTTELLNSSSPSNVSETSNTAAAWVVQGIVWALLLSGCGGWVRWRMRRRRKVEEPIIIQRVDEYRIAQSVPLSDDDMIDVDLDAPNSFRERHLKMTDDSEVVASVYNSVGLRREAYGTTSLVDSPRK